MGREKAADTCVYYSITGSPPHGRGKESSLQASLPTGRITPAWAGKSLFCFTAAVPIQDHPRMGGEKWITSSPAPMPRGSPPHGRGKVGPVIQLRACAGITPAWAGKRPSHSSERRRPQDHPRVGGEKSRSRPGYKVRLGSPPRGRGKVSYLFCCQKHVGITPAWAGKSWNCLCYLYLTQDHPRVGGEKPNIKPLWTRWTGSPPRGRGKASFSGNSRPGVGITPAWAGKSHGGLLSSHPY